MSKTPDTMKRTNIWLCALMTGFFAGLIFGMLKIAEHYFHFTNVPITFIITPYFMPEFLLSAWGIWLGWGAFTLMSIVVAFVYAVLLRKTGGPWAGFGIGIVCWGLLYWWLGWLEPARVLGRDTLIVDGCLFLLWGAFIGYSISFEFTSDKVSDPSSSQRKNLTNA